VLEPTLGRKALGVGANGSMNADRPSIGYGSRVGVTGTPFGNNQSMREVLVRTIAGIAVALTVACSSKRTPQPASDGAGGQGDPQDATCARLVQRLLDCKTISSARLAGCQDDDPTLSCAWKCMNDASCVELKASYCDNAFNSYASCLEACHELKPQFVCDDGSPIDASWHCDGVNDCPNGEDEVCKPGMFTCNSGLRIPASWQCDKVTDCAGGDDERDCPDGPMISCGNGQSLPASRECDGVEDCAGGDDERGCAKLTCD